MQQERIHIIGGGISALVAAFELTNDPAWQDRYHITIHQMGWRLGGKAASGRNASRNDRIEEHGLHLFFGYYENAFRVIRRCYAELGRPSDHPLAHWEDAFKKRSRIVCKEAFNGEWHEWVLNFAENDEVPGDSVAESSSVQGARMMLALVRDGLIALHSVSAGRGLFLSQPVSRLIEHLMTLDLRRVRADNVQWLVPVLRAYRHAVRRDLGDSVERDFHARQTWGFVDFGVSIMIGMIVDDLISDPVDWHKLDHLDFRDWLRGHGASDAAINSGLLRALADASFATRSTGAAGTSLHMTLRMLCTYKGAIVWEMQGAMGEVVIAPLYELLRRRGVTFEFFHRADRIELGTAPDGRRRIERVVMGRQATLKDQGRPYEPLRDVKGVACWPNEPFYDQLTAGDALRAGDHNLENWWGEWPDIAKLTLTAGVDFDRLILAVGAGVLPYICEELIDDPNNPRFGQMVRGLQTTMTQAAQLWMKPTLEQLGADSDRPVVLGFAQDFNTWADMSHHISRESWTDGEVGSLAYLCAALEDETNFAPPPRDAHDYPWTLRQRVITNARSWLGQHAAALWPRGVRSANPDGLDLRMLEGPRHLDDDSRLRAQHMCASWNPSDRYVLAPVGNTQTRLRSQDSGYANLVLAGDWTLNSFSMGCAEAATASGLHAAATVGGRAPTVIGNWLDQVWRSQGRRDETLRPKTPPTSSARPRIRRFGELMPLPPYVSTGTTMRWLFLAADHEVLAQMCTQFLNLGRTVYRPFMPWVALVATDMERTASKAAHENYGWLPERDYGFWVPLMAGTETRTGFRPERVVWFQPYMWVESGPALSNGREIFGMNKALAELSCTDDPLSLSIRSLASNLGRDEECTVRDLVRVAPAAGGSYQPDGALTDGSLFDLISGAYRGWADTGVEFKTGFARDLLAGRLTIVTLKQTPSAQNPAEACYQAVIELPTHPISPVRGSWISRDVLVDVFDHGSHRLVETLGLLGGQPHGGFRRFAPAACFRLQFDFEFSTGRVVP